MTDNMEQIKLSKVTANLKLMEYMVELMFKRVNMDKDN